ncbi:MAG: class I SAM-dependent methyltransferase [Deltaproteobacteria bacterium]|nr:class I SAM-dependent methyltransferase [Deltaproteobacteria bacterium]
MSKIMALARNLLAEPDTREVDPDSDHALEVHARVLKNKAFLKKLYTFYYEELLTAARLGPRNKPIIEIGAGSGFLKDLFPGIISLDIRKWPGLDLTASALELPFKDSCVSSIVMLDAMHHLPRPATFFKEASRVLSPGGIIAAVEPYNSPFSRIFYKHVHQEPFDEKICSWALEENGPMSASNQALPWIMLVRDRDLFKKRFPELNIVQVMPHTMLLYILSGGLSYRQLAPEKSFDLFSRLEASAPMFIARFVATMATYVIEKS